MLVLCVGLVVLLVLRADPLNVVPHSFQTSTLLQPEAPAGSGKPKGPQRTAPKPKPSSANGNSADSKRPPKAKTAEQQAKNVTCHN